ncbi:MFS transporter, partial [Pseudomonas oryzihabitans]|uniref:MFS transporter n=1 Tax=Pseudomonas oryzihabitans TaxID=47885 RepID=UPI0028AC52DE
GGLAPLLVAPLLGRYLAETAGFLRKRGGPQAGGPRGAWLGAIPLSTTLLLWLGYFFTLTVMYMLLNWLPSLLVGQGFSRGQAVGVQILFNLGGGIGSVLFGLLMDRWRPRLTVLAIYLGILLGLAGLGLAKAYSLVALAGFAAGLFVVGGQLVLYALAPQLYPAAVRATGTGAAVAVGRLGAMAGPLLAGQVLALGGGAATLVVATTPAVLVAAGAVLALLQRRAPVPAVATRAEAPGHA